MRNITLLHVDIQKVPRYFAKVSHLFAEVSRYFAFIHEFVCCSINLALTYWFYLSPLSSLYPKPGPPIA